MDFKEFRARISIGEMAEKLGYKLDTHAGKSHLCYYLGDYNNRSDEIVIYNPNNPAQQTYFSRKGSSEDKGNLINFVLNRLSSFPNRTKDGFAGVNEVLTSYVGGQCTAAAPQPATHQETPVFNREYWKPQPVSFNNSYLTVRRKISPETVKAFAQRGFVFEVGRNRHIGFPFRKPGTLEFTNFELRNYFAKDNVNYKGFCPGGDKSHSLWIANFVPLESVREIYLFESAIDAMSFFEIYRISPSSPVALVSTGGHVTSEQITSLQRACSPEAHWNCCYDRDGMGQAFDVATAYYLEHQECKCYKKPNDKGVSEMHVSVGGINFVIPEECFSSRVFLSLKGMKNINIIKCNEAKDWNEMLAAMKDKAPSSNVPEKD